MAIGEDESQNEKGVELPTTKQLAFIRQCRWLAIGLGLLFMLIGVVFLIKSAFFINVAEPTEALVTAVDRVRTDDGYAYRPTFEFQDKTGTKHTATTNHSSSAYNFQIGQTVDIRYSSTNPQWVYVDTFMGIWGTGTVAFALGLVSALVGIFAMPWIIRQLDRREQTTTDPLATPSGVK